MSCGCSGNSFSPKCGSEEKTQYSRESGICKEESLFENTKFELQLCVENTDKSTSLLETVMTELREVLHPVSCNAPRHESPEEPVRRFESPVANEVHAINLRIRNLVLFVNQIKDDLRI